MQFFYFERCKSCDEWKKLLNDFGQKMNESGIVDVAIGMAECTPDKGLCGGISRQRLLSLLMFLAVV